MKSLTTFLGLLLLLCVSSCSNVNEHMEEMIPADATAVYCVKMPSLLKKAGLMTDDQLTIPSELKEIISSNEGAWASEFLGNLKTSGIDLAHNIYFFFTQKTFRYVALVAINDVEALKQLIEHRTGERFKQLEGVDFLRYQNFTFAIDDDVLFWGRENRTTDDTVLANAASAMLDKNAKSMLEVSDMKECIDHDAEINAYLDVKGFNAMLSTIPSVKDVMAKYPLLSFFTDSDIKALTFHMKFEEDGANLKAQFKADENSDFVTLLNTTLSRPSNEFLKAMPTSMKYVCALSVNGKQLAQLEQVKKSLNLLNNLPSMEKLNVKSIVETFNGPIAIGVSPSYMSSGDESMGWFDNMNVAIVAQSSNPDFVINTIKNFAAEMGQPDFLKDGHHVYNYQGMPMYVGNMGNVVYAMRLDHELTEGFYDDYPDLKDRFAKSQFGFFAQADAGQMQGLLNFGFSSYKDGEGLFYTARESDNAALTFISILCTIAPQSQRDESDYVDGYDI